MAEANGVGWGKKLKRAIGQIGWVRLAITFVFITGGLYLARYAWDLPLTGDAERGLYDLRFQTSARTVDEPDNRIVLLVYNDDTLRDLGKRSPLDRHMLAQALRALDAMQPRAIGIDILIDQAQPEDGELINTFRALRTPTYLAFATHAANPAQVADWQEAWMRGFLARVGPGQLHQASIRLGSDLADGVVRRWTPPDPLLPIPLLANAMTSTHPEFVGHEGPIDFVRAGNGQAHHFPEIQIDTLAALDSVPAEARAAVLAGFADQIRGRYVLIGGDINDLDDFATPITRFTGQTMKGVEVHGQMLAQQLDGRMRQPLPAWTLWLAAVTLVALGGLTAAFELSGWRLAMALIVQIAAIAGLPFELQNMGMDTLNLPAVGWGAGWLLAFIGVGAAARAVGSEQRRFAQSALGKYLPADVALEIMRDPERISLHGEQTEIFALFTDLEGFTKLSHAITPETLSRLLNRYLDLMSAIVLEHGGTLDKFVGDALVTFWGAPIARPGDADRALRAGIAMYTCGEEFRANAGDDVPPIGVTRVGLHHGEAVVGNFGGEGRIQYTALGDAMNCASRLESANKALKTTMLVSDEAKRHTTLDLFRPMGRIVVSGRSTPVEVWEPVPDMDAAFRKQLNDLWRAFDGGDTTALARLEEIAAAHKEDAALQYFVYRIGEVGPGGHFVLGSK